MTPTAKRNKKGQFAKKEENPNPQPNTMPLPTNPNVNTRSVSGGMTEGKPISIEMGALAEPIGKQLKEQGIDIEDGDAERFEKIAHSIVLLHLHDIIPDSVRDSARKKLMNKISKVIHKDD